MSPKYTVSDIINPQKPHVFVYAKAFERCESRGDFGSFRDSLIEWYGSLRNAFVFGDSDGANETRAYNRFRDICNVASVADSLNALDRGEITAGFAFQTIANDIRSDSAPFLESLEFLGLDPRKVIDILGDYAG